PSSCARARARRRCGASSTSSGRKGAGTSSDPGRPPDDPVIRPTVVSVASGDLALADLAAPLPLDALVPGGGPWEVEIGFGKGKYLLARALAAPERRFLGIEVAAEYHRLFVGRARRRGLGNWAAIRGEALYLASAVLPRGFAADVH